MSETRPPMIAGPIARPFRLLNKASVKAGGIGACGRTSIAGATGEGEVEGASCASRIDPNPAKKNASEQDKILASIGQSAPRRAVCRTGDRIRIWKRSQLRK